MYCEVAKLSIELACSGHSQRILFSSDSIEAIENKENFVEAGLARYKNTFVEYACLALRQKTFPPYDGIIADGVPQPEYSYAHAPTKALRERFGGGGAQNSADQRSTKLNCPLGLS